MLLRFRSARPEAPWRPGQVSQEERIAAVIVIVLMAALVYAAFAVYALNGERTSAVATPGGGRPALIDAARNVP
jgi:hypothetical protein